MVSLTLGPPVTSGEALADLRSLLSEEAGRRMVDEWCSEKLTRIIVKALEESSSGRTPRPGLSEHDFACAAGEAAGMQRVVAFLRDPELILGSVGISAQPERPPMPKPTYAAPIIDVPVPPPAAGGNEAAPQSTKGERRKKTT